MADCASPRILFVDDDELIVRLTSVTLRRAGWRITPFCDPRAALAAFEGEPRAFDLVVADVQLGVMSGVDMAARMLQVEPAAAIVLTSGLIVQDDHDRAMALGVRAVVPKGHVMTDLPRLLRQWLPLCAGQEPG